MLFDTHTHLNDVAFEAEIPEAVQRAKEHDVSRMAVVGFDEETIKRAMALSKDYSEVYNILGWHPTEAIHFSEKNEEWLWSLFDQPKIVAVGEMGLDYHWDTSPKNVQADVFRRQLRMAKQMKLPVSIHMRDATEDTYRILKEEHVEDIGGIMHTFGETPLWMERFLDLNMHISISGVVTFKKAFDVHEAAKTAPIDRLLIETDAPYLAPVPYRGKRNEPAYVQYVAKEIAKLRDMSYEEIGGITMANANRLFGLTE